MLEWKESNDWNEIDGSVEWPSWSSEKRMINKSNVLKLVIRNKFMQVWIYMNSQNVFNFYKNEKVTPYEHDKT